MADETTPTPPPSASPTGFFSKPPQRPAATPSFRPPAPARPTPPPPEAAAMPDDAAALGATEPHPWMRYFARLADILIGAVGIGIVIGLIAPGLAEINTVLLGVLVIFGWIFFETVLLATWGTTPGKWLLGVTLRTRQGAKLDAGAALVRSFNVWLKGLGLGIPIVSLFTLIFAYKRLKEQGETSWDAGQYEVSHAPMSAGRIAILVVVAVVFVLLSILGAMA